MEKQRRGCVVRLRTLATPTICLHLIAKTPVFAPMASGFVVF